MATTSSALSSEYEGKEHQYQDLSEPGPRGPYESRQVNGGFYVRVDMPGVPPDGVKLTKRGEAHTVTFTGKSPRQWPDGVSSDRVYCCYVVLDCNPNEIDIEMTVVNGSLRLFFPNADGLLHFFDSKNRGTRLNSVLSMSVTHNNPFLLAGVEGVIEQHRITSEKTDRLEYVRVDVPGVGEKDNMIVGTGDGVTLYFSGYGSKDHRFDEGRRSYSGGLSLLCTCCKIHGRKHTVKDGVLSFPIVITSDKKKSFSALSGSSQTMKCTIGLLSMPR